MKLPLLFPALLLAISFSVLAGAPQPLNDFNKTLSAAAKDQKLAFILLGRSTCEICNETRAMIKAGRIMVTTNDYVMGDLNVDDPRTHGEFMRRYGKEKFGDTLPFVVVTDSQGKLLASSGGHKDANEWNMLLTQAKRKVAKAAISGDATTGADPNWPFKTPPKPQ